MPLPDRPNLEFLRQLAKDKLQELRRADPGARLADTQLAVARQRGFPPSRACSTPIPRSPTRAMPRAARRCWPPPMATAPR
jgi:hypothetical protein